MPDARTRKTGTVVSDPLGPSKLRAMALDLAIKSIPLTHAGVQGAIPGMTLMKEAEIIEAWLKKAEE